MNLSVIFLQECPFQSKRAEEFKLGSRTADCHQGGWVILSITHIVFSESKHKQAGSEIWKCHLEEIALRCEVYKEHSSGKDFTECTIHLGEKAPFCFGEEHSRIPPTGLSTAPSQSFCQPPEQPLQGTLASPGTLEEKMRTMWKWRETFIPAHPMFLRWQYEVWEVGGCGGMKRPLRSWLVF